LFCYVLFAYPWLTGEVRAIHFHDQQKTKKQIKQQHKKNTKQKKQKQKKYLAKTKQNKMKQTETK
jgi:hypothetical protein